MHLTNQLLLRYSRPTPSLVSVVVCVMGMFSLSLSLGVSVVVCVCVEGRYCVYVWCVFVVCLCALDVW